MNAAVAEAADTIILCHKPAQLEEVAAEIGDRAKAVVSILGGTPTAKVEAAYPGRPVYRFMPSIPVEIGRGVLLYAPGERAVDGPEHEVLDLFRKLGTVVELAEEQFDAGTAVMSCGPAFFALVAEALAHGGAAHGIEPGLAQRMAVDTMAGTAAALAESGYDTAELQRRVTSPGGMTERGLAAFDDAVTAVVERGRE